MNFIESKTSREWIVLALVTLLLGGCAGQPTAPEPKVRRGVLSVPLSVLASQEAKLTASDAMPEDLFGYSVALSGDLALIGSLDELHDGMFSGALGRHAHRGTRHRHSHWTSVRASQTSAAAPQAPDGVVNLYPRRR